MIYKIEEKLRHNDPAYWKRVRSLYNPSDFSRATVSVSKLGVDYCLNTAKSAPCGHSSYRHSLNPRNTLNIFVMDIVGTFLKRNYLGLATRYDSHLYNTIVGRVGRRNMSRS